MSISATQAVALARAQGAEKRAPYEYTVAVENLEHARELAGYSRYHDALGFGKKAHDWALRARDLARDKSDKPNPNRGEDERPPLTGAHE